YNPRNILERIFLNSEKVLDSGEIWLCAWCYRCYRYCPQALKPPEISLYTRRLAVKAGYMQAFEEAIQKIVKVSGPAGLNVAYELALKSYEVTIFEL
ncbi:hypothetical protein KEJ37_03090, partial [Candidatus Bathyarchaeota archaeon]|nr:hypothetical protein [Candidatus Bathyarchaeota archaeon]